MAASRTSHKKKTIRAMHATSERTEHVHDWQSQASAIGWSDSDIDGLVSVLKIAKDESRVVEIKPAVIHMLSIGSYVLDGIDRNGQRAESVIPYSRPWTWAASRPIVSLTRPIVEEVEKPWCAKHGVECHPTEQRCGIHDIAVIETCDCGKYHERQCEVGRRIAEERVEEELRAAEMRKRSTAQLPAVAPAWVAPKTKRKRVTKATGWLLPGQTAMELPTK